MSSEIRRPPDDHDRVHRVEVQMRFADTDALGHVNNGSFIVYAETGRLEFLRVLGSAVRSLILAHISADFRRQVLFGAKVEVETWVERIGTTSVTLMQNVRANGDVAAEVRSVVVSFDYATQRPMPWSAESRAALEAYVRVPAAAAATPGA
jgi:acyl-CoA thioester hydrolase